jgi:SAM-dependent methyltransferase
MLDASGVASGARVLDVAAGSGGQTRAAAQRVGRTGHVLATDLSPAILAYAEDEARLAGLSWISTRVLDAENLDVEPGSFDAVISRLGFMYFPNQQDAFRGMLRALRPGGRVAGIVFSTSEVNGFFSRPVAVVRRHAQLAPPAPGMPGPFTFGPPGVAEAALTHAGFIDVAVRAVQAPVRLSSSAECVQFERESFGALHQMLSGLDEAGRAAAWTEIAEQLSEFDGPDGFVGPCELLVVSGARPHG